MCLSAVTYGDLLTTSQAEVPQERIHAFYWEMGPFMSYMKNDMSVQYTISEPQSTLFAIHIGVQKLFLQSRLGTILQLVALYRKNSSLPGGYHTRNTIC